MQGFIKSTKTFRYSTLGNPETAKTILYVLHGYGQLSEYFIKKFENLQDDYFIVAPEGMHRFYLKGSSGRVGASWMTKEDRDNDISDNLNWLNELADDLSTKNQFEKTILLGFSQGGATALRWSNNSSMKIDQLIIWAAVFPPDLVISAELINSNSRNRFFVIGNNDEFYSENQRVELINYYNSTGFISSIYDGNHDINVKTLKSLLNSTN